MCVCMYPYIILFESVIIRTCVKLLLEVEYIRQNTSILNKILMMIIK